MCIRDSIKWVREHEKQVNNNISIMITITEFNHGDVTIEAAREQAEAETEEPVDV